MADFGYDVADHCDVDPAFGSLADAERLVGEAHARGLRVLVDFVPNHTSEQHPWFIASRAARDDPKRGWYVWRDPRPDGTPPNNWRAAFADDRRLLAFRRSSPALHAGTLRPLPVPDGVLGYERAVDDERLVVLVNFTDADVPIPGVRGTALLGSRPADAERPFDGTLAPDEAVIVQPNGRS